jgi:hypothetical protein
VSEYDPLDTAAQAAAKEKETEAQRLKREREVEDFKFLMSSVQGRRFVWRMLEKAGVFRSSFSLNGLQMAFSEGNRNLGLMLIGEIHEHCPERYHQMVKEQREYGNRSKRPN